MPKSTQRNTSGRTTTGKALAQSLYQVLAAALEPGGVCFLSVSVASALAVAENRCQRKCVPLGTAEHSQLSIVRKHSASSNRKSAGNNVLACCVWRNNTTAASASRVAGKYSSEPFKSALKLLM